MAVPRAACGVMAVSIFRHPRVWYTYMRLGEAADEFLYSVIDAAGHGVDRSKVMAVLRETVGKWNNEAIQQRAQMLRYIARDIEDGLHISFSVFVKDVYAEELQSETRTVRVRMPRLTEFVHHFFQRLVTTAEVRRGSYFHELTMYRNHAVSNAMISALSDMCVDNVRVDRRGEDSSFTAEEESATDLYSESIAPRADDGMPFSGSVAGTNALAPPPPSVQDVVPNQPQQSGSATENRQNTRMQTFRPPVTRMKTQPQGPVQTTRDAHGSNVRAPTVSFAQEDDLGPMKDRGSQNGDFDIRSQNNEDEFVDENGSDGGSDTYRRSETHTQKGALRLLERLNEK